MVEDHREGDVGVVQEADVVVLGSLGEEEGEGEGGGGVEGCR